MSILIHKQPAPVQHSCTLYKKAKIVRNRTRIHAISESHRTRFIDTYISNACKRNSIFVIGFPAPTFIQTAIRTLFSRWTYFTFIWGAITIPTLDIHLIVWVWFKRAAYNVNVILKDSWFEIFNLSNYEIDT